MWRTPCLRTRVQCGFNRTFKKLEEPNVFVQGFQIKNEAGENQEGDLKFLILELALREINKFEETPFGFSQLIQQRVQSMRKKSA